ncbi:MAG TPA: hypothetical protein VF862_15140 [Gemmatimonadales bacterium]
MSILLWAILAIAAGAAAIAIGTRRVLRRPPPLALPPGETLAPTALQVMARRALLVGLALIAAAGVIVVRAGADTFYDDDTTRVTVTLLMLAALVVLASFAIRARALSVRPGSPVDERDVAILDRAPLLEGNAMLVTLVFWVIGLQETYHRAGAVPLVWLYLVMWSMLLLKALVLPLGVLIGYRRS